MNQAFTAKNLIRQLLISLLIICSVHFSPVMAAEIRIALRAHQGNEHALKMWQATADYLTKTIPEHNFSIVPFESISLLNEAISRNEYDFCLTNPSSFIKHKIEYDAQALATLVNKRQGHGYSKFGSVIFTRSDRDDISKISDLKGKSFIAVDELAFGGWRIPWKEFLRNNINPYKDFSSLSFAGGLQQDVVFSVKNKLTDAGAVRTDMLERLSSAGLIDLKDFKVIAKKNTEGFPFLHSTPLYPEWVFSTAKNIESHLKTKVIAALFAITEDSKAATSGMYVGWISPLDYSSVEKLLNELHVGPYDIAKMSSYERLKSQYGLALLVIIAIIVFLVLFLIYMSSLYQKINNAQKSLKEEVLSRESLERQLMHIQKMESLGQLTGGIAHDFNNMLASMLGYTELSLSLDIAKNDKKLNKYLEQVILSGDKAKHLISQMLAFSRTEGDKNKTETVLVHSLVTDSKALLRPLIPSNIDFVVNECGKKLYIKINRVMFDQVLMNLCLNSKDAIKKSSGKISISTRLVNYEITQCSSCHNDLSGAYVAIEIQDNGTGIDSSIQPHLFEPFFSTKDVGKGTGMGLSMVHGIIHEHDGHILLKSSIDTGTVFTLLLPEASGIHKKDDTIKVVAPVITSSNINKKHILLIDDEVAITTFLSELLMLNNFKVTSFNSSQKAVNYFRGNHKSIDLVLTDQTMPDLTGLEIATKIREIDKDALIILCTGYSEKINASSAKDMNINYYLEKPIETSELLKTINSLTKA